VKPGNANLAHVSSVKFQGQYMPCFAANHGFHDAAYVLGHEALS